ncbi:ATP-binding protein [Maribacter litopenaei]|uniref:histidine kinase n=1 Tax=Maribacter litopenaei TaxID=2976127 RepID=A0ABY5Y5J4_9FLAO|nr:hybrid sensor histidine kinase/response regulator [Maribacter litopenaei]UWX53612.1 ATP-binding protein [Maribacter litopenaei]
MMWFFYAETLLIDRKIDLQLKIDGKVPGTLVGDPSKLSQILLNLLGNSIKFVEEGFIRLEINLKEVVDDRYNLEFKVQDTGIGMSKEQLTNIFQCFKQADAYTASKYGGTGLGLCIVKELVEKQGGEISAESHLGTGSTFKFTIPYKKGTSKNIPKQSLSTINTLKGKELLKGTGILVFEDNQMNQHLIQEQLTKWGCKVFVTSNADKGLGILKSQRIDLILMDLKMPDLNGFQISDMIRTDNKINQVPIIAVSADFTAKDEENCIAFGINDFLLKPYTLDELMKKLLKAKSNTSLSSDSKRLLSTQVITGKSSTKIDLQEVLDDCCGEMSVMEELIRLFKQNVYEFIGSVKINLKQGNLKEIGFAAHKLKAGLKMLKLEKLAELMVDMQATCEDEDELKVRSMYQDFLKYYPEYEAQIEKAFVELKKEKGN